MAKGKKKNKAEDSEKSSEPDPNLYFGNAEFTLPNGDKYVGDYCAHRYGLIWREGHGIYITQDGHTYEGEWKDDKLIEQKEITIKYPGGEEYHGALLQDKYFGPGTYILDNQMSINCEFIDNKPKQNIVLIDINGRVWQGQAKENNAILLPENEFYNTISQDAGIGKLKEKYQQKEATAEDHEKSAEKLILSEKEKEQILFAKSTKTTNDIDFSDSKWCQRYLRYQTMKKKAGKYLQRKEDAEKQEEEQSYLEEEMEEEEDVKKWLAKYHRYEERQKQTKKEKNLIKAKESKVDTSLLDEFYSKEYRASFPVIKVMYPSSDWNDLENSISATEQVLSGEHENEEKLTDTALVLESSK